MLAVPLEVTVDGLAEVEFVFVVTVEGTILSNSLAIFSIGTVLVSVPTFNLTAGLPLIEGIPSTASMIAV